MYVKDDFPLNPHRENENNSNDKNDIISTPKVHFNPNFQNSVHLVIHVNPRMQKKPMVHVNPLMMKNILSSPPNSKILNNQVSSITRNVESLAVESKNDDKSTQKSIHVNPKLMEKLSSIARADIKAITQNSKLNTVDVTKNINKSKESCEIPRKRASPRKLLTISRRKLVRIPANKTNTSIGTSQLLQATKSPRAIVYIRKSVNSNKNTPFKMNKHTSKLGTYKIDRTNVELNKRKKVRVTKVLPIRSVNKGLVAIGGVMYQSSRTRLVRSSSGPSVNKKRKSSGSPRGGTFVVAKNGKKLHRLSSIDNSFSRYVLPRTSPQRCNAVKRVPDSIINSSHKNVISYKAKQRSLQILRDKLRKNYIPCLIFRRFGFCANHEKGTCSKLHDKKQVALCRNFLQGKCLLDQCPMSHDIGPEKMPTCKYFLEGCCIRDACPYLHVKVSSKTPLCAQFLRGYCADGSKCKQRHAFVCPTIDKGEKCRKGKNCPYPHKLKSVASVSKTSIRRKPEITANLHSKRESTVVDTVIIKADRKRYYDNKAVSSEEKLTDMRENLLKQMELRKTLLRKIDNFSNKTIVIDDEADDNNDARRKRPPIGPLPSYIPIN